MKNFIVSSRYNKWIIWAFIIGEWAMILISALHSCKRILLLSFLILLSSVTLVAQVKIKEKIVLTCPHFMYQSE